jgi:uncharacterized protein GlcG (DUF336 family)
MFHAQSCREKTLSSRAIPEPGYTMGQSRSAALALQLCLLAARPALATSERSAVGSQWTAPGRPTLTLAAADAMADAAIGEAEARGFNDVSVFVLDATGRTLVSKTMLGCPPLPQRLAHAKAMACVATHAQSSRALRDKYVPERTPQLLTMTAIGAAAEQPLAAVPGGVLCRDATSAIVGSIGVSGASADEDEHCAIVGARACGLATTPSDSPLE